MPSFDFLFYTIPAIIGYFMGSLPYGLFLAKSAGISDLRSHGSGNIGATNAYRVLGKKVGAATLILDVLKGTITVLTCRYIGYDDHIAGMACVVGHIFPVWLKFRGGKGVATYFGVLLAWAWLPGLLSALTWLSIMNLWRFSSLAALISLILSIVFIAFFSTTSLLVCVLPLVFLIVIRHSSNITRLLEGQETKI